MRAIGRFLARAGRFLFSYLLSLVFHWEGLIPAVLLLVLHFWPGIPLYWFFIALGLWMLFVLIRVLFFRFAIRSSAPTPFQPNRNPYSKTYRPGKGITDVPETAVSDPESGTESAPSPLTESGQLDPIPQDLQTDGQRPSSSSISPQPGSRNP